MRQLLGINFAVLPLALFASSALASAPGPIAGCGLDVRLDQGLLQRDEATAWPDPLTRERVPHRPDASSLPPPSH